MAELLGKSVLPTDARPFSTIGDVSTQIVIYCKHKN